MFAQKNIMQSVSFPGSFEVGKPKSMTDEQCMSIPAFNHVDDMGYPYWLTAWKPSYEDLQALNRGEPIYIKTVIAGQLPPMTVFTIDEEGKTNDAQ